MATTPTATTGANVRAEMARRKVSQMALAAQLGLSQAAVSARLNGHTPFDINELSTIARVLDVPLTDLLADVEAGVA
jgi:transcriptional regulator with XRE-family HTH domain